MKAIIVALLILLASVIPAQTDEGCYLLKGSVVSADPGYVMSYYMSAAIGDVEMTQWMIDNGRVKITEKSRKAKIVDEIENGKSLTVQVEFLWEEKDNKPVRVWTFRNNFECMGVDKDGQKL